MWIWGSWDFWICSWPGAPSPVLLRTLQTFPACSIPISCTLLISRTAGNSWEHSQEESWMYQRDGEQEPAQHLLCPLAEPPPRDARQEFPIPRGVLSSGDTGTARRGQGHVSGVGFGDVFGRSRGCDDAGGLRRSALARGICWGCSFHPGRLCCPPAASSAFFLLILRGEHSDV